MRSYALLMAGLLALGTLGCSDMMTSSGHDELGADLARARVETTLHLQHGRAAVTMADVAAEMTRHEAMMGGLETDMREHGDMGHCDHGSDGDHMNEMMDGMMALEDAHASAVDQAVDVTAARAEIERHVTVMTQQLDDMDGAMADMPCM